MPTPIYGFPVPTDAQQADGPTHIGDLALAVETALGPKGTGTTHTHALDDLSNVDLTVAPTTGQALVWDSTATQWKAGTVASGGLDQATADGLYVNVAGDTVVGGNLAFDIGAVVFTTANVALLQTAAGVALTDALGAGAKPISIGAPTVAAHAATKLYVDDLITVSPVAPDPLTDIPLRDGLVWMVVP